MSGFNLDDIMRGYSADDEFIARDILILELLVEKGIITKDDIAEKFKELAARIYKQSYCLLQ